MKKTFAKKKSAFSLIELSIVLIIIGLLIAGVTGGAALIKSSELRSVMGEARGFAVAVNAFYTQYDALPGDYTVGIRDAAIVGDGDGEIDYYRAASASGSESANAWATLRHIGAIDVISTAVPVIATTQPIFGNTSAATAPGSKIKGAGWVFDYRRQVEGLAAVAANQNAVVLTATITVAPVAGTTSPLGGASGSTSNTVAALIGADALSIDAKIDDGVANAGKVRGVNPGIANNTSTSATCMTYSASANVNYITTGSAKVCALSYQVDVNS
jgi:prepilin-type N-terminal cleavage/methylation domain-containing protein